MRNNCCNRPNCKLVIEKYHKLLKEAEALFEASEELVDREVISSIICAIKALRKSLELAKKGYTLEAHAERYLEESGCDKLCNKDSKHCECLLEEALKEFALEEKNLIRALELLEQSLYAIKDSIEHRRRGYVAFEKYVKCVHHRKPAPNPCHMPPCRC